MSSKTTQNGKKIQTEVCAMFTPKNYGDGWTIAIIDKKSQIPIFRADICHEAMSHILASQIVEFEAELTQSAYHGHNVCEKIFKTEIKPPWEEKWHITLDAVEKKLETLEYSWELVRRGYDNKNYANGKYNFTIRRWVNEK